MRYFSARRVLTVVCLSLVCASLAIAESAAKYDGDWLQWRGPNRDGQSPETGLLGDWSAEGPPLAWRATGLGAGFAGVSMQGDRIFTMGMTEPPKKPEEEAKKEEAAKKAAKESKGSKQSKGGKGSRRSRGSGVDDGAREFVIALNRADGKELWKTEIGASPENGGYRGPRRTPALDGDLLYAIGSNGDLVCLETATGKPRWTKNLKTDFGGKMMSMWGYSESPLIDGDRVICTPGGKDATLVAFNKLTGEVIWKSAVPDIGSKGNDGAAYSSIVISNGAGTKQYVQLLGHGLVGVRADDGKFLWGYNKIANSTANIPTALVKDDYVFISTGYGTGAALLQLKPDGDTVKADEVYFLPANELQNHHGGYVLIGDYLYMGHGHNMGAPSCMDFKTGKKVWRQDRGPGTGSACVLYADGRLYFRYQNGVMALVEATPQGYHEHGTFKIPGVENPSWPHPVIAGGKLYLREQNYLYCYNLK